MEAAAAEFEPANAHGVVYLNSAGMTQLPRSVVRVGEDALRRKATPWDGLADDPTDGIRSLFAELIGVSPADVAICPSTAYALSTVARNLASMPGLRAGAAVIVLEQQMASNVMPWQALCARRGLRLVVVKQPRVPRAGAWAEGVIDAMAAAGDVTVVALPAAVHWCNGSRVDIARVADAVHAAGASRGKHGRAIGAAVPAVDRPLLVVDGTQSIGAMPFDAAAARVDVVACSVHKWLAGPYGCSLLYVAPALQGLRWAGLEHHERNRVGSDHPDYDAIGGMGPQGYPDTFVAGARRFEPGGRPNPVVLPMVRQALLLVTSWTPQRVQAHCDGLGAALRRGLAGIRGSRGQPAYRWDPEGCGHIVGVAPSDALIRAGATPIALGKALAARRIVLSVRAGWLRVALWVANTERDVDALLDALRDEAERAVGPPGRGVGARV